MNSRIAYKFPFLAIGKVIHGFQRGSKELGIPTANLSDEVVSHLPEALECGIYYGWAALGSNPTVHKCVISIGWNPFYDNTKKSMEVHILHQFEKDFYEELLKVAVVGYLREEKNFGSVDELISAIHQDISQASELLDKPQSLLLKSHPCFTKDSGSQDL